MRLIDADVLKKELAISGSCNNCAYKGIFGCLEDIRAADVCGCINEAPTVEAIPVKWILDNERMPKKGAGRFAILEMIEDWRKYTNDN